MDNREILKQVKKDYYNVNLRWMKLHVNITLLLAILAFLVEAFMFLFLNHKHLISSTTPIYFVRYLLFPTLLNSIFTFISFWVVHKTKSSPTIKKYTVSLSLVAMCFIISVVHGAFLSIYCVFTVCIIMTIIYGDFKLTTTTALLSMVAEYISAMFTAWDSDKIYNAYYPFDIAVSIIILFGVYLACITIIVFECKKQTVIFKNDLERYQLRQEILKDGLTGTFNKVALQNHLKKIVDDEVDTRCHLVLFDVDNFKQINDTYGHLEGDKVIRSFGEILNKHCDESCIPFRFGGDEFCILFIGNALENVISTTKKIKENFNRYVQLRKVDYHVTVSAGIAEYIKGMTPEQLLENADIALYRSKGTKNSICLYD